MTIAELMKLLRAQSPTAYVTINGFDPESLSVDKENNLVDIVSSEDDDDYPFAPDPDDEAF